MEEIRHVIEEAYVQGVHERQDEKLVRQGFDDAFRMFVKTQNTVSRVGVSQWMVRVAELRAADPELWQRKTRAWQRFSRL